MPWVYLDDGFDQHPKVVAVGSDAAWMFVAGLCWSNRNLTAGRIPRNAVRLLTDRRHPGALARRLVEERLWEEDGDGFLIHDYAYWNKTAKGLSDRAKKAAQKRWDKERNPDAGASAPAELEQVPEHSPGNTPTRAPAPGPRSPTPEQVSSSSHSEEGLPGQTTTDDDDPVRRAAETVAERRLARQRAEGYRVGHPQQWLATATANAISEVVSAQRARPDVSLDDLIDELEPPHVAARKPHRPPDPVETTGAAQALNGDLNEARLANPCPACNGTRFVDAEGGAVAPCETCNRTGVAPELTTGRKS